jgi:hypothetical protein
MDKNSIKNVPRFYEPHVSDCFHNALAAQLLYMGLNPNIILADYLSFLYDSDSGYMGVNYLYKYNTSVEFTEEELNTSFELAYFPVPEPFDRESIKNKYKIFEDRIIVRMYLEKDADRAYSRVKELIDENIPAVVAVDLFYMQYHKAYKKEHGLHYVVITGYNEEEGWFELFDKYRLSGSDFDGRLPIEEVQLARNSDNPQKNALMGEFTRPLQNVWCEVEIHNEFNIQDDRIMAVLMESCKRMRSQKRVLGCKCGFEAMDALLHDLANNKRDQLDEKNLYMFKTYYNETFKTIARSRKRFKVFINELSGLISPELQLEIASHLDESSRHWDICANLSLKLGITKKLLILEDIINQLQNIKQIELKAVELINNSVQVEIKKT